ncbi:sensor histidine kinase [Actinoplanes sp. NPDC049118]|uniref:sensor histidine kinase n=1 Tax=Actinoplanes sp. NPDC049118 TaxID=3155769 RepID=UPI0033E70B7A
MAGVLWTVPGAVLVTYRPRNIIGWLLLTAGACNALFAGLMVYAWYGLVIADPSWSTARWALTAGGGLFVPGWLVLPTLLIAFYPDGRLPARWLRWPVGGAAAGILLFTVMASFDPDGGLGEGAVVSAPIVFPTAVRQVFIVGVCLPLIAISTVAIWAGAVVRFLRARSPQREQLALLACVAGGFLVGAIPDWPPVVLTIIGSLIPVAIAVGVLRYRLLGIAIVLRRGLVYGALTAAVVSVYLLVSAFTVRAIGGTPVPGVVAAAVVAVGLTPARDQLQRVVDRFVYGPRADPVQAVSHLGGQVAEAEPTRLLRTALESVAESVGAVGAAVVAVDGHVVSSAGGHTADQTIGSLRIGGRDLGVLRLATRYRPPRSLTVSERRLHAALTTQVAVVVLAVNLTDELKAERDRVVAATRAERDRLRRDLHDGLGPSLSGVGLGLQGLTDLIAADNTTACALLLERLRAEVITAVNDVRRIIDDLRPAALDRLSLTDALRRQAASLSGSMNVTVTADGPRPLPPCVENTTYRIATEALTNIARHAHARNAKVSIVTDDQALRLIVADDGTGGANTEGPGVGLTSMRHRAESLGGRLRIDTGAAGTTVTATLPLEQP